MRMRAIYFQEFFEDNSQKFSKFESENEGNLFESFGNPSSYVLGGIDPQIFCNNTFVV